MRSEQAVFDDLANLCASPGFIHAIAWFCVRDNLIAYKGDLKPDDLRHLYTKSRIIRSEMVTLQGLLARVEIDFSPPEPKVHKAYCDKAEALLSELHDTLLAPWRADFQKAIGQVPALEIGDRTSLDFSGASLREPIFYGGESAYSFQYRDFAPLKYLADKEWLLANRGFDMDAARLTAQAILDLHNEVSIMALEASRKANSFVPLLEGFVFSVADVAARSGLDADLVARIVEAFTLPTDSRNPTFRSLSDFNAVSAQPIFRYGDRYVLLEYFNLVAALYETPIYWMTADKAYGKRAFKNRGVYAEQFATNRLAAVFGPENVFPNVLIPGKKGETLGEVDVLVFYAGVAIVVQAKTRRLSLEARSGNDRQIKKDFQEAIQEAHDQAFDCAALLLKPGTKLLTADRNVLTLPSEVTHVLPLCLVADHYPALALQAQEFLKAQQIDKVDPALVIDVFALDAIAEMLETPLRFLSYLRLRGRFGHKLHVSHEMTLLSDHIKRNLWVEAEYDFVTLDDDLSIDLEVALLVRREGLPGKRTPEGVLTRFAESSVGRLLKALEANPQPGTVELGLFLLELNEKSMSGLSLGIDKLVRDTRSTGRAHAASLAFDEARTGLTLRCLPRWTTDAHDVLRAQSIMRKYERKASTWYGLIFDPNGDLRAALKLDEPWVHDENVERALATMPNQEPWATEKVFSSLTQGIKIGRNEPCPCGSGRKYKKCCLGR